MIRSASRPRIARQHLRVALPVFGSEDFNARDAVISNSPERADDLFERQNAEAGKQAVTVFQLLAGQVFRVVDVKDEKLLGIERIN